MKDQEYKDLNWTDVNLPFDPDPVDIIESWPEYPYFYERAKEKFGMTYEEAYEELYSEIIVGPTTNDEWREWQKKYSEWAEEQPETIEYRAKMKEMEIDCKNNSFIGQGLNKPGTLIELEDGSIHLIGTINKYGGVCDDCLAFDNKIIVKRYAVIIEL